MRFFYNGKLCPGLKTRGVFVNKEYPVLSRALPDVSLFLLPEKAYYGKVD